MSSKFSIQRLYKNSKEANVPLLSSFDSEFWSGYLQNYERFDNLYARMYYSFVYHNGLVDESSSIDDIRTSFSNDVYNILMKNSKNYEELFRIQVIPDDDNYSITSNFIKKENYSGSNNVQSANISGQRTDVSIDNIGEQNRANVNKVTGWNSSGENVKDSSNDAIGSREEVRQFTRGQETDTARSAGQDSHNLSVRGNVGMSQDEVMKKHYNFWSMYNFYKQIFDDICEELLLIGGDGYDC